MRVLVTGAAGFLGSHVVDRLIAEGHDVTGLDNLKRGNKSLLDPYVATGSLRFCEADIRDIVAVKKAMLGCDTVFHLAAQSNVMGALDDPDYSFESNVIGTYNVLKAASIAGVRSLVFSSSREVYGEPRCLPASEDLPVEPRNPYGASKLAGEAYCRVWRETMGLNCTVLRFGNLYGPRDSGRVIPIWLRRAGCGQELILFGGQQVLDFVWVDLAVEALLRAVGCGTFGPINIASGIGTALQDLAVRIQQVTRSHSTIDLQPARSAEVTRFVADISRMKAILGLAPDPDPLCHLEELLDSSTRDPEASRVPGAGPRN